MTRAILIQFTIRGFTTIIWGSRMPDEVLDIQPIPCNQNKSIVLSGRVALQKTIGNTTLSGSSSENFSSLLQTRDAKIVKK